MSWSSPSAAIPFWEHYDGDGSDTPLGAYAQTSTSSILLTVGAGTAIRMFIDAQAPPKDNFYTGARSHQSELWEDEVRHVPSDVECETYDTSDNPLHFYPYLDSAPAFHLSSSGVPATALDLGIYQTVTEPHTNELPRDYLFGVTCVPGFRYGVGWPHEVLTYNIDHGNCIYSLATAVDTFCVLYKDPCVLALPEGRGYLMIMARVRVLKTDAAGNTASGSIDDNNPFPAVGGDRENLPKSKDYKLPGGCISDVVAFWAPNATFTTGLKGPFLLADSLDALDFAHRRAWLGVPGGTFVKLGGETWLYLHYVVERHDPALVTSGLSEEPPDGCEVAYSGIEVIPGPLLPPLPGVPALPFIVGVQPRAGFTRGIALRRFHLSDILDEVVNVRASDVVKEDCWRTDVSSCGWTGAVTGENLGLVNFWMAVTGVPRAVVAFEEHFLQADNGMFPQVADPRPILCSPGMTLYFGAIQGTPGAGGATSEVSPTSGHGVWRGAVIGSGATLAWEGGLEAVAALCQEPTDLWASLRARKSQPHWTAPPTSSWIPPQPTVAGRWVDPPGLLASAEPAFDCVGSTPDAALAAEVQRRSAAADAREARGQPRGIDWSEARSRVLRALDR